MSFFKKYCDIHLEFKLQDMWIGAYWERREHYHSYEKGSIERTHIWICILPTLPIHIVIYEP